MSQPKLAGIHHLKIPVTDLTRSIAWYEKVFRPRVTWEFPEADGVCRGVCRRIARAGPRHRVDSTEPAGGAGLQGLRPGEFRRGRCRRSPRLGRPPASVGRCALTGHRAINQLVAGVQRPRWAAGALVQLGRARHRPARAVRLRSPDHCLSGGFRAESPARLTSDPAAHMTRAPASVDPETRRQPVGSIVNRKTGNCAATRSNSANGAWRSTGMCGRAPGATAR